MATSNSSSVCARFDGFQVDLTSGDLRTPEATSVRIQQQPLQVLRLLLAAEGRVVTREQLRVALWPDHTFVDFEHGVNTAVKKLRQALGDSVENPKFVETVPKVGYRLLVPVEWVTDLEDKRQPHTLASVGSGESLVPQPHAKRQFTTRNLAVMALIVTGVFGSLFLYRRHLLRSKAPEPSISLAVTSVGEKYSPSLSPDGKQLAFAWNGGNGPFFSIYVKLIGTEEPLRLTKQESVDYNPVWSPDGRYIAFCRIQKGETGIYIVPTLGGAERKVRDTHWEEREFYEVFWYFGRLSWSPDGKLLCVFRSAHPATNLLRFLYYRSTHSQFAELTSPGLPGDYNPAFSPDGQTLAFNRGSQGVTSIYTVAVAGGEEHRLITGPQYGWGLAWTPDGRNIVFGKAGWLAKSGWLWKVSAHGGEPERLQFGQEGTEPSIRGNRLAYARQITNLNIWRRKLDSLHSSAPAERFLSSTTIESGPQFSPDGSKIVFESTRSGAYEVWMCRSDGSRPHSTYALQLCDGNSTLVARRTTDCFRFSCSRQCGHFCHGFSEVARFVSSPTRRRPTWCQAGREMGAGSISLPIATGEWQVWKMPSAGGPAVQVTHHGGYGGFESLDGKIPVLHKRCDRSGNMANSDHRRRRDRSHRLAGSRLLGLLGHSRKRDLLPRYDSEAGDRLLRFHYSSRDEGLRLGKPPCS